MMKALYLHLSVSTGFVSLNASISSQILAGIKYEIFEMHNNFEIQKPFGNGIYQKHTSF